MRLPTSYIQHCKTAAHALQALLLFVGGCITLAVFTKGNDKSNLGGPKWYFALCFLTIPALIYLVMVPTWTRAIRFANVYAFTAVDGLWCIFWFSAFIAVQVWKSNGISQGEKDHKLDSGKGNCTTFAYGTEQACTLAAASVGLGAIIWILFGLTTGISVYYMMQFRKNGDMPFLNKGGDSGGRDTKYDPATGYPVDHPKAQKGEQDNAWSTDVRDMDPHHDHDSDDNLDLEDHEHSHSLLHSTETEDGAHPGRPLSWGEDRSGRGYRSAYAEDDDGHLDPTTPVNASALSPGGYDDARTGRPGQRYNFE